MLGSLRWAYVRVRGVYRFFHNCKVFIIRKLSFFQTFSALCMIEIFYNYVLNDETF